MIGLLNFSEKLQKDRLTSRWIEEMTVNDTSNETKQVLVSQPPNAPPPPRRPSPEISPVVFLIKVNARISAQCQISALLRINAPLEAKKLTTNSNKRPSLQQKTVTHDHWVRYTVQLVLKIFKIVGFSCKFSRARKISMWAHRSLMLVSSTWNLRIAIQNWAGT